MLINNIKYLILILLISCHLTVQMDGLYCCRHIDTQESVENTESFCSCHTESEESDPEQGEKDGCSNHICICYGQLAALNLLEFEPEINECNPIYIQPNIKPPYPEPGDLEHPS